MATTAQDILTAAIATSLANDGGTSPLANNNPELIAVLSRKVRQIYGQMALPNDQGGSNLGDFFKTTWAITVATPSTNLVALPSSPEIAYIDFILNAGGNSVSVVPAYDLLVNGTAEVPPAVLFYDRKLRSCGRTGDPNAGDVLTIYGSYLPAILSQVSDFIGATTLSDATTTTWPSDLGDPYLVAWLGLYLAMKDATRGQDEVQNYVASLSEAAQLLAARLGLDATTLVSPRGETKQQPSG